jgi:hypothetical protein
MYFSMIQIKQSFINKRSHSLWNLQYKGRFASLRLKEKQMERTISRFLEENSDVLYKLTQHDLFPNPNVDLKEEECSSSFISLIKEMSHVKFSDVLAKINGCISRLDSEEKTLLLGPRISDIETMMPLINYRNLLEKNCQIEDRKGTPGVVVVDLLDLYINGLTTMKTSEDRPYYLVIAAFSSRKALVEAESRGMKVIVHDVSLDLHKYERQSWQNGLNLNYDHSIVFDYRPLHQSCAFAIYEVVIPIEKDGKLEHRIINPGVFRKGKTFEDSVKKTLHSEMFSIKNKFAEEIVIDDPPRIVGYTSSLSLPRLFQKD